MEDIGGRRSVLEDVDHVYAVAQLIMERRSSTRPGQPWWNVHMIDYLFAVASCKGTDGAPASRRPLAARYGTVSRTGA